MLIKMSIFDHDSIAGLSEIQIIHTETIKKRWFETEGSVPFFDEVAKTRSQTFTKHSMTCAWHFIFLSHRWPLCHCACPERSRITSFEFYTVNFHNICTRSSQKYINFVFSCCLYRPPPLTDTILKSVWCIICQCEWVGTENTVTFLKWSRYLP